MPLMKGWKAKLLRCSVLIVIGALWGKLAGVLKQERRNISRMLRIVLAVQTFGVMDIALTLRPHNNSKLLPSQCSTLFKKIVSFIYFFPFMLLLLLFSLTLLYFRSIFSPFFIHQRM